MWKDKSESDEPSVHRNAIKGVFVFGKIASSDLFLPVKHHWNIMQCKLIVKMRLNIREPLHFNPFGIVCDSAS